jgi:dolichyl-phosphate beta-glucosyltransferase
MDKENIFISIVVPAYNEENRITIFLSRMVDYLTQKTFLYEIIIVDDENTDCTIEITESLLKEKLPCKYKILKQLVNLGKGAALGGEYWRPLVNIFFL